MNQPVKKNRSGSIAGRINNAALLELFIAFLLLDLMIVYIDNQALIRIQIHRQFKTREILPFLSNLFVQKKYIPLLILEAAFLFYRLFFGYFSVRKELRPISDFAEMTFALSQEQIDTETDEEKFRRLEAAIEHISVNEEDGFLHTGDKELLGLEDAVNDLIGRMRESYREQARFVSDASHELRTPIAVIQGYANMLDRWGKTDETILSEAIEAIKTESEHMNYLVEQLLFLARGDNGRNQLSITRFDLSRILQEAFEEYQMIDPDHHYTLRQQDELWISGDSSMIKQTLRILLDNAKKYTDKDGEIDLYGGKNSEGVYFSVRDNGIGISPEALPHIFDRFYRADNSRTRDTGGTGLGLSIAKWIIDKHNGRFRIISRPGFGTKITVFLPGSKDISA